MKVLTINVKSLPIMTEGQVRHDITKARVDAGTAVHKAIVIGQEIAPPFYKRVWDETFVSTLWSTVGLDTECPISFKGYTLIDHGKLLTNHGFPLVEPTRWDIWARLEDPDTFAQFVVVNGHWPSAAWSKRKVYKKLYRKLQWKKHFRKQDRLIKRFLAQGLTVITGGDENRRLADTPKFDPRQVFVTTDPGYDHLSVIAPDGGAHVTVIAVETRVGYNSDHQGQLAHLHIGRPVLAPAA